jgi:cellulose synthase (UDP-forming)
MDGTARREQEKYIAIFDADMNPFPDFIEPLVAVLERNPRMAFVQTPQYYTNFESNRIARASGLQQAVFYEYICEGKSIKDAMFCCGTNVIFRREALMDVGGFDESSVTEDFATSFKFHLKGWHSSYLNKACAFGMGPEDLGGYFKQQFRWCLGTVGLFRKMLLKFLKAPGQLPAAKWLEYFLSGTHYFIGWAFLVMLICPVLYLFFRVPSYFASPKTYFLAYSPYFLLAVLSFLWTLKVRDYRVKDILLGTLLIPVAFPIYIRASLLALLGVKGKFTITPKGGSSALPLVALWPQIGMAVLSLAALVWGADRLYYEGRNVWAVIINGLWCAYNFFALSLVFYFNNPGGPGDA